MRSAAVVILSALPFLGACSSTTGAGLETQDKQGHRLDEDRQQPEKLAQIRRSFNHEGSQVMLQTYPPVNKYNLFFVEPRFMQLRPMPKEQVRLLEDWRAMLANPTYRKYTNFSDSPFSIIAVSLLKEIPLKDEQFIERFNQTLLKLKEADIITRSKSGMVMNKLTFKFHKTKPELMLSTMQLCKTNKKDSFGDPEFVLERAENLSDIETVMSGGDLVKKKRDEYAARIRSSTLNNSKPEKYERNYYPEPPGRPWYKDFWSGIKSILGIY